MIKLLPFIVIAALALSGCKTIPEASLADTESAASTSSWFSIPAPDRPIPLKYFPAKGAGSAPSVFLVHGTNGPDSRQEHWAKFFNDRGYNALIIDLKTGRYTGPQDRANLYPYPLIERAHAWLLKQPTVDPQKIVWMGFSLGAALGLMAEQHQWAAFLLFYPTCWNFTKTQQPKPPYYWAFHAERPRVKPTLVIWGKDDQYEEGKYCPEMIKLMSGSVQGIALEGAHHGFDGSATAYFRDPASPSGMASLRPSAEARRRAEDGVRNFLQLPH